MASYFGKIDEFNPQKETFSEYEERLSFFFEANGVTEDSKKRAIFITVVGSSQFRLLKDLCIPRKVSDFSCDELCHKLREHHEPAPPKYLQRAVFEARNRKHGESPQTYITELRHLAEHCEFGAQLEDRLCEKFARGIGCEEIQRKLLSKPDLKLSQAVEIAVASVKTREAARELQHSTSSTSADLNFSSTKPTKPTIGGKRSLPPHKQDQPRSTTTTQKPCYRCGGSHAPRACKFKTSKCFKCDKTGHIAKVCRSSSKQSHSTHHFDEVSSDRSSDIFTMGPRHSNPINVELRVCAGQNGHSTPVNFQLDTGSSLSVINKKDFDKLFNVSLRKSKKALQTYTGEKVRVYGETDVYVSHHGDTFVLPLLVIEGSGPPLIGRNWLSTLRLDWSKIFFVARARSVNEVLEEYSDVFGNDSGLLKGHTVSISVNDNTKPKFFKARHPPYVLRPGIEEELARLQREGIIEKVDFSEWATPIVPVLKKDKQTVRICGDYKVTVNKDIRADQYPIPLIEELAHKLVGGEKFSTLDFSDAYTQLELDEQSQVYTTINTHKGLFRYKRLCFGLSSSPGIFQRVMDSIFQDLDNTVVYFDNLYLTGKDDASHMQTLEEVLRRCQRLGLRLRRDKCEFFQDEVDFLGYRLNKEGLQPNPAKVKAIRNAPRPTNTAQLKSFLGLINYYGKFINNLASILEPLYLLLQKNVKWNWGKQQESAFQRAKAALTSKNLLVHFDPKKQLVLICDASPYGVGAILAHRDDEGEKPIFFASRSLNKAERNYAHIDREALSIIFGLKKFRKYLLGQSIEIVTDHKPLLGLLGEGKPIPENASLRVQRWALLLSAFSYRLIYRAGHRNNADALSRLPLQDQATNNNVEFPPELNNLFEFFDNTPVTAVDIARETQRDPVLKQVQRYVLDGWPDKIRDDSVELKPYFYRRSELSVENGCILWGSRVVIPSCLTNKVLTLLHEQHVGISRMKGLARCYVWWPHLDIDIERTTKMCPQCELYKNNPPKAPLHPWDWPDRPWQRLHMDFAGPFLGKMYLIIVDAHSKWIEVKIMNKINANETEAELRDVFSTFGLPDTIVTDNGPTWTSEKFQNFMNANGVEHITSAPYHPATNGLAERCVQTFKNAMRCNTNGSLRERVSRFLTKYRCTPHSTTGVSPAELMMNRKFKTHLDLLHPSVKAKVLKQQQSQIEQYDKTARSREIGVHDNVLVRNYSTHGNKWEPGTVQQQTGPLSYRVSTPHHGILRRHANQIRPTNCDFEGTRSDVHDTAVQRQGDERNEKGQDTDRVEHDTIPTDTIPTDTSHVPVNRSDDTSEGPAVLVPPDCDMTTSPVAKHKTTLRRSHRTRKPPERFEPS